VTEELTWTIMYYLYHYKRICIYKL